MPVFPGRSAAWGAVGWIDWASADHAVCTAGVGEFDGDGLACMSHADLDTLAGDLDAAPAGDPPLDDQSRSWQRLRAWPALPADTCPATGR